MFAISRIAFFAHARVVHRALQRFAVDGHVDLDERGTVRAFCLWDDHVLLALNPIRILEKPCAHALARSSSAVDEHHEGVRSHALLGASAASGASGASGKLGPFGLLEPLGPLGPLGVHGNGHFFKTVSAFCNIYI
jgi:hypothetical protein